ncbi:MAG: TetR/AcrR family transcriptional regulator C-terminal domain-containing protein [Acidimicrobiales bacterium]|jgi:AcrR family transcriptional regulator
MPRPRSLDHDAIAHAALALVDRDGLASLSMRAVAAELGVGTMSLYRYVTGREEVERLIVDSVFFAATIPVSKTANWERDVTELSEAMRGAIAEHPAVIPLLLARFAASAAAWHWLEALLRALSRAGFDAEQRVTAVRTLQAYVIGAVQSEYLNSLAGQSTAALASMPYDDFPLIVETARSAMSVSPDQEFAQGLATVLTGLRVSLRAR